MSRHRSSILLLAMFALGVATWSGCTTTSNNEGKSNTTAAAASPSSNNGKLPVTTASEEAKKEFLQGRDLAERLLIQDSTQHFDKAIALDSNFASAELARANSSPTTKEFFDHLKRAVSLADKASEGEKLLILASEAGANGDVTKQKEYLDKLVAAYPNEERVHFNLGGFLFGQHN
jgi:hypothetical protein